MKSMSYLIFLLASLIVLVSCSEQPKVCFDSTCFEVEIADTREERMTGLMHREMLDENKGMLFIFENVGNYPFWMKNTLIPLDMLWIDWEGNVVHIQEYAVPCKGMDCPSYDPETDAKYVLEINGGLAREKGIEIGDKIKIEDYPI